MKMIKKAVLASALLLAFHQGAMAADASVAMHQTPVNSSAGFVQLAAQQQRAEAKPLQISQEELAAAFESATPEQKMQMAALSGQEMKETEGAFWWFFVPLVVRATPALISYAAGSGGTFMIPTWYSRIRLWW